MTYVETDCTITHEGKSFEAGGAVVTPEYAIGYFGADPATRRCFITDWHGKEIGSAHIVSSWTVRSYLGSRMYQIEATIDGVKYTGRGFGEGMSWKGKRCARQ